MQGRPMQQQNQNRNQPNQNRNQQGGGNGFLDFNQISELPTKYPRPEMPENCEENMELGGTYQEFLYCIGDCCGNVRIVVPCCCCV